jgi:hypothetical protein
VLRQLFGCESEFLVRHAVGVVVRFRIIKPVNNKLAFDGDGLAVFVIEVEPAAETANGRFAWNGQDIRRPNRGETRRLSVFALGHFGIRRPRKFLGPFGFHAATSSRDDGQDDDCKTNGHSVVSGCFLHCAAP